MKQDVRELVITGKKEIVKLERFVEEICEYYNINNDYFGNILLATTEAAGILFSLNDSGDGGKVAISFDRNRKGLIFKIKLENGLIEGEDSEDLLDREIRRHKLSRDIFIIKALTDEITISVNAKSIVLVFYVSSMNYEKSLYRINQLKDYWVKKENVIQKK
jgi:serine/threonine-protein kinase RsbW